MKRGRMVYIYPMAGEYFSGEGSGCCSYYYFTIYDFIVYFLWNFTCYVVYIVYLKLLVVRTVVVSKYGGGETFFQTFQKLLTDRFTIVKKSLFTSNNQHPQRRNKCGMGIH